MSTPGDGSSMLIALPGPVHTQAPFSYIVASDFDGGFGSSEEAITHQVLSDDVLAQLQKAIATGYHVTGVRIGHLSLIAGPGMFVHVAISPVVPQTTPYRYKLVYRDRYTAAQLAFVDLEQQIGTYPKPIQVLIDRTTDTNATLNPTVVSVELVAVHPCVAEAQWQ